MRTSSHSGLYADVGITEPGQEHEMELAPATICNDRDGEGCTFECTGS